MLIFIFLLSQSLFAEPSINLEAILNKNLSDFRHYELPQSIVSGSIDERRRQVVSSMKSEIENVSASKNISNYSTELKTEGDCESINSSQDCHVLIIGRRKFSVKNVSLKDAVAVYTTDLFNPKDKVMTVKGVDIKRFHWSIKDSVAKVIVDEKDFEPLKVGVEYKLKKCRNGLFVSWKCNTIAYQLFQVDPETYFLLGKQAKTDGEPMAYLSKERHASRRVASFLHRGRKKQSGDAADAQMTKFNDSQRVNSSAGTLSFVLFKKDAGNNISVYELNEGYVDNSSNAKKMLISQSDISSGLEFEYRLLAAKFSAAEKK